MMGDLRHLIALGLCNLANWISPDYDEDGELERVEEPTQPTKGPVSDRDFWRAIQAAAEDVHWQVMDTGEYLYLVEIVPN